MPIDEHKPKRTEHSLRPTPDAIVSVQSKLKESPLQLDHLLADYLANRSTTYKSVSPLRILGLITRPPEPADRLQSYEVFAYYQHQEPNSEKWGIAFIREWLHDLRKAICGSKGNYEKLSHSSTAFIT